MDHDCHGGIGSQINYLLGSLYRNNPRPKKMKHQKLMGSLVLWPTKWSQIPPAPFRVSLRVSLCAEYSMKVTCVLANLLTWFSSRTGTPMQSKLFFQLTISLTLLHSFAYPLRGIFITLPLSPSHPLSPSCDLDRRQTRKLPNTLHTQNEISDVS